MCRAWCGSDPCDDRSWPFGGSGVLCLLAINRAQTDKCNCVKASEIRRLSFMTMEPPNLYVWCGSTFWQPGHTVIDIGFGGGDDDHESRLAYHEKKIVCARNTGKTEK